MAVWFTCINERVDGPFSTDDVKNRLSSGELAPHAMVWGKLLTEWMVASNWLKDISEILSREQRPVETPRWHYAYQGSSHGPFLREDLANRLLDLKDHAHEILIWTKGMKSWAPMYEFHDLMDLVGVNRRQHPRAPIEGRVVARANGRAFIGVLKTISEGGFGATGLSEIEPGIEIHCDIQSEKFYESVHAIAEVRYVTETGFVGLKFKKINMENKSSIIQYVKSASLTTLPRAA